MHPLSQEFLIRGGDLIPLKETQLLRGAADLSLFQKDDEFLITATNISECISFGPLPKEAIKVIANKMLEAIK